MSHRRQRHFNPAHAGAVSSLDARFLSGFANGDQVTTWTARSGSSPTQATPSSRPTYAANGINGCPAVAFASSRLFLWSPSPISGASAASFVSVSSRSSNTGGALVVNFGNASLDDHGPFTDGNYYHSFASTVRKNFTAPTATAVESCVSQSGSWAWTANGATSHSTGTNTVGIGSSARIGANAFVRPNGSGSVGNYGWTGNAGAIAVFASALSDSLKKRVCHAFAFSFKIAHS